MTCWPIEEDGMESKLKLERPLVFFDIETTHLDIAIARIVEIAMIKLYPNQTTESFLTRVNPGVPIPSEATRIHGITNFDVIDKPSFRDIAGDIYALIENCDLAGYNLIAYDLPILVNEFKRAGIDFKTDNIAIIDVLEIFRKKERRNLAAAYQFYCQKQLNNAHSALKDTQATLEIFQAQLNRYADLPTQVQELHEFCNQRNDRFIDSDKKFIWQNNEACFAFGRYKGTPLRQVVKTDVEYIKWMLNSDFSIEVQNILRAALNGQFPIKTIPSNYNND